MQVIIKTTLSTVAESRKISWHDVFRTQYNISALEDVKFLLIRRQSGKSQRSLRTGNMRQRYTVLGESSSRVSKRLVNVGWKCRPSSCRVISFVLLCVANIVPLYNFVYAGESALHFTRQLSNTACLAMRQDSVSFYSRIISCWRRPRKKPTTNILRHERDSRSTNDINGCQCLPEQHFSTV